MDSRKQMLYRYLTCITSCAKTSQRSWSILWINLLNLPITSWCSITWRDKCSATLSSCVILRVAYMTKPIQASYQENWWHIAWQCNLTQSNNILWAYDISSRNIWKSFNIKTHNSRTLWTAFINANYHEITGMSNVWC